MGPSDATSDLADRIDDLLDGLADGCIADAICSVIATRLVTAHREAFHPNLHPAIDAAAQLWIGLDRTVSLDRMARLVWDHNRSFRGERVEDPAARVVVFCVHRPSADRNRVLQDGHLWLLTDFWCAAGFPEDAIADHFRAEAECIVDTNRIVGDLLYPPGGPRPWLAPWGA